MFLSTYIILTVFFYIHVIDVSFGLIFFPNIEYYSECILNSFLKGDLLHYMHYKNQGNISNGKYFIFI